jgi:hypothetical protein
MKDIARNPTKMIGNYQVFSQNCMDVSAMVMTKGDFFGIDDRREINFFWYLRNEYTIPNSGHSYVEDYFNKGIFLY